MQIHSFEEIKAWGKARELINKIYRLTKKEDFKRDWGLADQIRRAAVSVMNNIAEGFDSGFNTEFIRFLILSRRSASEVQNHLYVALDQEYLLRNEFQELYKEVEDIRKMVNGFISYLRTNLRVRKRTTRQLANTLTR